MEKTDVEEVMSMMRHIIEKLDNIENNTAYIRTLKTEVEELKYSLKSMR